MNNTVNIEFLRKRYDKLFEFYNQQGLPPAISQIRIEHELINGRGSYTFNLKKENTGLTEQNMKRNDLLVVLGLSVFLSIEDPAKPGKEKLLSYVPVGDNGFKTDDIEALYNGKFYFATGTTVNIEDMPTMLFKRVKTTQVSDTQQGEFSLMDDIHMMAETLAIAGTQDHTVTVTFPSFATANYAANDETKKTKLVFIALAYKVPGGTSEQFRIDPANPSRRAI